MSKQIKDLKAQLAESNTAKQSAGDDLAKEKQNRISESNELRKQLKDLTESNERETRDKNDKIKRLQEDC